MARSCPDRTGRSRAIAPLGRADHVATPDVETPRGDHLARYVINDRPLFLGRAGLNAADGEAWLTTLAGNSLFAVESDTQTRLRAEDG